MKNTDPDDVSLYDGKGYFPRDDEYKQYLNSIPANSKEVSQPTTMYIDLESLWTCLTESHMRSLEGDGKTKSKEV